jgi:hypothetical protein
VTGCYLRHGANWQGALKQKGIKQGFAVHTTVSCVRPYNFIQTIQHTRVLKGSLLDEGETAFWFLFLCERR